MIYRGRFAPTPNGNLHIGSLYIAIASWCDARANNGKWFLRFDNLDQQRTSRNYEDNILFFLESIGLLWDEKIIYQNKNINIYKEIFEDLKKKKYYILVLVQKKKLFQDAMLVLKAGDMTGTVFRPQKVRKK